MPSPEDFSQEQLKEAVMEFIKNNDNPTVKTVRRGVSVNLGLEPKALDVRKDEIKKLAFECIELLDGKDSEGQDDAINNEVEEKPGKNKRDKKRKRKSKKSTSTKNSFVVDDSVASDDAAEESTELQNYSSDSDGYPESDDEENRPKKKTKKARSSKRNNKPAMGRLGKLKRLARITGNINPKLYQLLKTKSEKKQINHLEKLFDERNIDYSDLSKSALQRIKAESSLQREIAELGGSESIINEGTRTKRTRKKVNYNLEAMSKIEDQSEDSGQEHKDDEDEAEDFYEPSGDEASDYVPSDH